MDKLKIFGGKQLEGTVEIEGAKNAALPIIAAAIMADSSSVIRNVPPLSDVKTMLDILSSLGASCEFDEEKKVIKIDPAGIHSFTAPYDMVRKMRASICLLGPLLARFGRCSVSFPGGCVIGQRPIDLHIKGLRALNVDICIKHGYIEAVADNLKGNTVFLGGRFGSSVLATANVMLSAVKAKGTTIIESAACEPELVDLADFLIAMGADICNAGGHSITINGVTSLKGVDYTVIPDRIEAGTYILAGVITRSKIEVSKLKKEHLFALTDVLSFCGVGLNFSKDKVDVDALDTSFRPVDITTLPFPGFPTDLQAQMMAFMATVPGISVITEKIFPERFIHIAELNRMAADISLENSTAIIKGGSPLSGAPVMASDLRASAALVLSALVATGCTVINRIYHLDRGYWAMEEKLKSLGARIERINYE
ncbi:UDP-N-acetylglucosamine 1-carboxyvinyltransferase [bacterium]|nr:UDP-N-acetylglucosamine 1-carboxyvinyltransferase [bacterium]